MLVYANPYPAKLIYLNFQPLEAVSRNRDPQLQVGKNYWYLVNFIQTLTNMSFQTVISFPITVIWSTNKTD